MMRWCDGVMMEQYTFTSVQMEKIEGIVHRRRLRRTKLSAIPIMSTTWTLLRQCRPARSTRRPIHLHHHCFDSKQSSSYSVLERFACWDFQVIVGKMVPSGGCPSIRRIGGYDHRGYDRMRNFGFCGKIGRGRTSDHRHSSLNSITSYSLPRQSLIYGLYMVCIGMNIIIQLYVHARIRITIVWIMYLFYCFLGCCRRVDW